MVVQVLKSETIQMTYNGHFWEYIKACAALWSVCYDAPYPLMEIPLATKIIGENLYSVELEEVASESTATSGDEDAVSELEYDRLVYVITPIDHCGCIEEMETLARALVTRYHALELEDWDEFTAPKPADVWLPDSKGVLRPFGEEDAVA
jgi:hypothetical protein